MSVAENASRRPVRPAALAIPASLNTVFAAVHILANIFQFFILPIWLLPENHWWALTIFPLALLNNPLWALIHEAVHDVLHPSDAINEAAGRLLSILFGAPFQILRQTHLSHHKFNRSPFEKGTEIYRPEKVSRLKASVSYYLYIVCGLYLLEVFSAFIFFLPRKLFETVGQRLAGTGSLQEKWLAAKFSDDTRRRQIRFDGLAIIIVFGLSALAYRHSWQVFLYIIVMRAFLVSVMDNVYHYRTPINVTVSGYNLSAPGLVAFALLNFNLHRVHHTNPSVPWTMLPAFLHRHADTCDRNLLLAIFDQFLGPVAEDQLQGRSSGVNRN